MSLAVDAGEAPRRARCFTCPGGDALHRVYAMAPDGQRFLILTLEEPRGTARIVIKTNWTESLVP